MEAKHTNRPQGQWINDTAAEQLMRDNLHLAQNGPFEIEIPEGIGRVVNPDGTFTSATHARLIPSKAGVKTAYPIVK